MNAASLIDPLRRGWLLALAAGALILAFAYAAEAQLPDKPLKPPLPSQSNPEIPKPPAPPSDKPVPPTEPIEQDRLDSTPDKSRAPKSDDPPDADELPPAEIDADDPTTTYNGAVAAIDLKNKEIQIKFGEEESYSFIVGPKTEIVIDDKPAKLTEIKATDPIIVTTLKDDTAEKILAVKLEVVRLKRTAEPRDEPPLVREDGPDIRQLDHAIALGAICVPTPDESVLVVAVDRDSPAERAGIRGGDFITKINGEEPQDILLRGDLVYFIQEPKSGLACNIVVWRAGKEYATELVVVDVDVVPKALPPVVVEERVKTVIVDEDEPRPRVDVDVEGVDVEGVVVDELPELERRAGALEADEGTKALIAELLAELRRLRAQRAGIKVTP